MAPGIIEKAKDKVVDAAEATKEGMQNVKDKVTGKQQERSEQGQFSTTGTAYGTQGVTTFHQQQPATGYEDPVTGYGIGGNVHSTYETNLPEEKGTLEKAKDKVLDTTKQGAQKIQQGAEKVKDKVMGSKEHDRCQDRCGQECTYDSTRVREYDGAGNKISDYRTERTDS